MLIDIIRELPHHPRQDPLTSDDPGAPHSKRLLLRPHVPDHNYQRTKS